ncbi:YkvA family protein [Dasania marina]|uniref:YkvA family protein n=1 Tax=Dasania marina TaxID=471499 RepID=UPI0030DC5DC5|tara:strand:+ start:7017 stop:7400 length:384 start_codon:yes stop_codon:yes gene_type:complete
MNISSLKEQAKKLKAHTLTVYFAARDPDMPILVRLLAIMVAAYALSPIDLIPDFIPVIGYLDDLIIIPIGLALVIRFTPPKVMESAQLKAAQAAEKPVSYSAAVFCLIIWVIILYFFMRWLFLAYNT